MNIVEEKALGTRLLLWLKGLCQLGGMRPVETNLHITRSGVFVFSPLRSSFDRTF